MQYLRLIFVLNGANLHHGLGYQLRVGLLRDYCGTTAGLLREYRTHAVCAIFKIFD